jgi:HEAT repeat protein
MAKRLSVDDKLAAVRRLRSLSPSSQVTSELRLALRDKSNLVAAAAASIVADQNQAPLAVELAAAFERFMVEPLSNDKLCRGKMAVVEALDKLEYDGSALFLRAARHVQLEPVWGGSEDTAAPLRAAAIMALLRIGYHGLLPLLVDALADPQKDVRSAAAQALGLHGSDSAQLVLRLKARLGDRDPDVLSECFSGLLTAAPTEGLEFVAEFLDSSDGSVQEAAVLALGRSRLPQAFDLLRSCRQRHPIGLDEEIFLAMAMLRLLAATDFLLDTVATDGEMTASAALSALLIYRYDPLLRDRIADAVQKSARPVLQTKFERAIESDR